MGRRRWWIVTRDLNTTVMRVGTAVQPTATATRLPLINTRSRAAALKVFSVVNNSLTFDARSRHYSGSLDI